MFFDLGLGEQNTFVRIEAGGQIGNRKLVDLRLHFLGVIRRGDRVQVDDAKDAIVLVLQFYPLLDGAEIVSQMNIARGADAAENAHKI